MSPARPRRALPSVLGLTLALLLAACSTSGGTTSSPPDPTGSIAPAITGTPSAAPSIGSSPAAAFPVTLTDDEGTAVELEAKPTTIVSLTPATTEILFAIGAGDRVVATDDASDFPAEAVDLPDVATFSSVDVERIVDLGADLVVAGGLGFSPPGSIAQLRELGIPVVVVYAPSVEGVYHDIELLGTATGETTAATELAESMRTEIDAIEAATHPGDTAPKVFYEIGYTDATGQIFAPADASFVAEMVTLAGGDVITTGDPASYEIPLETLIATDPQVIVLGVNPFYEPTPEAVKARPGWDAMTAVKDDAIRTVQDTEITRPGPRLATGLRNLAAAVRPDVTLPTAP
ncbi:MAG TPA: ABC transporter substrate-binding protein [Candidatus Saccharimonadales bacterium]|nr:ABC transporter substrate-binding protein [Candidatus Saccharimonadales bacterium]